MICRVSGLLGKGTGAHAKDFHELCHWRTTIVEHHEWTKDKALAVERRQAELLAIFRKMPAA